MTLPSWEGAACQDPDVDPEWWFPPSYRETRDVQVRRNTETAKALCNACPHQVECLRWALGGKARYGIPPQGIWGGLGEDERSAVADRVRSA